MALLFGVEGENAGRWVGNEMRKVGGSYDFFYFSAASQV